MLTERMQPMFALKAGHVIGSYRIVRQLGEGGMGVVYEVIHQSIGRKAAIKLLTIDVLRHPDLANRFVNEAKAANQIQHPGVVQIYEFGQLEDGTPWLLMEFLQGETLADRMEAIWKRGIQFGKDGLVLLHQLALILSATHERGIVHRDLKPGNIMLVPDPAAALGERVKLLDFGIAKLRDDSIRAVANGSAPALRTKAGDILGTPAYMAPEQCMSAAGTDAQADVYSLGVIAFQLFSGKLPHDGEHPLAIMAQKVSFRAPRLAQFSSELPRDLPELIASMLEPQPSERATMITVAREFARMLGLGNIRQAGFMGGTERAPLLPSKQEGIIPAQPVELGPNQETPVTSHSPSPAAPQDYIQVAVRNVEPQPQEQHAPKPILSLAAATSHPVVSKSPSESKVGAVLLRSPRSLHVMLSVWGLFVVILLTIVLTKHESPDPKKLESELNRPSVSDIRIDGFSKTPAIGFTDTEKADALFTFSAPTLPDFSVMSKTTAGTVNPPCVNAQITPSCITSTVLTESQKEFVVASIKESAIKLCIGDRLIISVGKTQAKVKPPSRPISQEKLDILLPSLLGRLHGIGTTEVEFEIRCKAR